MAAVYALDLSTSSESLKNLQSAIQPVNEIVEKLVKTRPATSEEAKDELSAYLGTTGHLSDKTFGALAMEIQDLQSKLEGKSTFTEVPKEQRSDLRSAIYLVDSTVIKLGKLALEVAATFLNFRIRRDARSNSPAVPRFRSAERFSILHWSPSLGLLRASRSLGLHPRSDGLLSGGY
jgi:hypothetical protein